MPVFTAYRLDTLGNPVEGYEVNARRELGEVYIPPFPQQEPDENDRDLAIQQDFYEQQVFQALATKRWISVTNLGDEELVIDSSADVIEVQEAETAFVARYLDGESPDRFLEMVPDVDAQTSRHYIQAEARAREALGPNASIPDREVLVVEAGFRPILALEPQELTDASDEEAMFGFWSEGVIVEHDDNLQSDSHQIELNFGLNDGRVGIEVVALDDNGRPEATDHFEWFLADWQAKPKFGFDPLTNQEIKPTKKQLAEVLVALDQALESR